MEKLTERKHFEDNFYVSGHTACAGCGQSMAVRIVLNVAEGKVFEKRVAKRL